MKSRLIGFMIILLITIVVACDNGIRSCGWDCLSSEEEIEIENTVYTVRGELRHNDGDVILYRNAKERIYFIGNEYGNCLERAFGKEVLILFYDRRRAAQAALGVESEIRYEADEVHYCTMYSTNALYRKE